MARYSKEFKNKFKQRMMPPNNESVKDISKETGISESAYKWRAEARANGTASSNNHNVEEWNTRDKFSIVLETVALSEIELSEYYCRSKERHYNYSDTRGV